MRKSRCRAVPPSDHGRAADTIHGPQVRTKPKDQVRVLFSWPPGNNKSAQRNAHEQSAMRAVAPSTQGPMSGPSSSQPKHPHCSSECHTQPGCRPEHRARCSPAGDRHRLGRQLVARGPGGRSQQTTSLIVSLLSYKGAHCLPSSQRRFTEAEKA